MGPSSQQRLSDISFLDMDESLSPRISERSLADAAMFHIEIVSSILEITDDTVVRKAPHYGRSRRSPKGVHATVSHHRLARDSNLVSCWYDISSPKALPPPPPPPPSCTLPVSSFLSLTRNPSEASCFVGTPTGSSTPRVKGNLSQIPTTSRRSFVRMEALATAWANQQSGKSTRRPSPSSSSSPSLYERPNVSRPAGAPPLRRKKSVADLRSAFIWDACSVGVKQRSKVGCNDVGSDSQATIKPSKPTSGRSVSRRSASENSIVAYPRLRRASKAEPTSASDSTTAVPIIVQPSTRSQENTLNPIKRAHTPDPEQRQRRSSLFCLPRPAAYVFDSKRQSMDDIPSIVPIQVPPPHVEATTHSRVSSSSSSQSHSQTFSDVIDISAENSPIAGLVPRTSSAIPSIDLDLTPIAIPPHIQPRVADPIRLSSDRASREVASADRTSRNHKSFYDRHYYAREPPSQSSLNRNLQWQLPSKCWVKENISSIGVQRFSSRRSSQEISGGRLNPNFLFPVGVAHPAPTRRVVAQ